MLKFGDSPAAIVIMGRGIIGTVGSFPPDPRREHASPSATSPIFEDDMSFNVG